MNSKLDPKKDPARRVLKEAAWPEADRRAWQAANPPGDALEPGGAAADWAPLTRDTVAKCYGRWLSWLDRNSELDLAEAPGLRVTPDRIVRYVADLQGLNASGTVLSRVKHLGFAVKAMAPGTDWDWLQCIVIQLRRRVLLARDKRAHIQPSDQLYAFGLDLMETADGPAGGSPWKRANDYRDGLMIALLTARPFRRRNFTVIEIGRHLVQHAGAYWLQFEGAETKTGAPIEAPFPTHLIRHLEHYLKHFRPFLLQATQHWQRRPLQQPGARLWVTSWGSAMSQGALYNRITRRTKARFGRALSPHLFRDSAATTVATEDPAHVQITLNILGHSTLETSERHYNHARSLEATRRYQQRILALRRGGRDEHADPVDQLESGA